MQSDASQPSDANIQAAAQLVIDQMSAPEAGSVPSVSGWCLALGPAHAQDRPLALNSEKPLCALGESEVFLKSLDPASFDSNLSLAIDQHFGSNSDLNPSWVVQYLLAESPSAGLIAAALKQMLAETALPREQALLRLSALGSDWISDSPEDSSAPFLLELLEQGALTFVDQGVFEASAAEPDRFETLARFKGADGQILSAAQVLTGQETDKVLAELDRRMLLSSVERLCSDESLKLSVNVCRTTLQDSGWYQVFEQLQAEHPEATSRMILEITEWPTRAVRSPLTQSGETLGALKVDLWLDDFGAGLTSFNEVFLEGLSGIKIDRNLLRRSIDSGDAFQALKVVTDFARAQGKICVIEGAENDVERAYAEAKGATHVQGFFSGVI